jgi:hypothetical protein
MIASFIAGAYAMAIRSGPQGRIYRPSPARAARLDLGVLVAAIAADPAR